MAGSDEYHTLATLGQQVRRHLAPTRKHKPGRALIGQPLPGKAVIGQSGMPRNI